MSNGLKYDALLVRELARELDRTLCGARLEAAFFDRQRLRLTLHTAPEHRRGALPPSLVWQLHPSSGQLTTAPIGRGVAAGAAGRVRLRPHVAIARVTAPADERMIIMDLDAGDAAAGIARRIIIELLPNQWNAVATGFEDRIIAVLRERATQERTLRAGVAYEMPQRSARTGATDILRRDEWFAALADVEPARRIQALVRSVAWTGPLNAAWIIGDAGASDGDAPLERAFDRYLSLIHEPDIVPVLERCGESCWQPYIAVRGGAVAEAAEPAPSLLDAFTEAATRSEAAPPAEEAVEQALAAVAVRRAAAQTRLRRLEAEQAGAAEDAVRLRHHADLLLSQLHLVTRGMTRVRLDDHEGGTIELELDPVLGGADNAQRLYAAARKRERAAARIPDLLRATRRRYEQLEELGARVRVGTATPAELQSLQRGGRDTGGRATSPALPYRTYRSTGGLEIRVGRGSRANDELTFRHSSPNDIWLHARDAAGAHVILRWPRADANPPTRDIADAAVLAALSSRARTSATVPVDWTRRKHVRKRRKAGPGLVVPERVRTLFVQPDPQLEERLRIDTDFA